MGTVWRRLVGSAASLVVFATASVYAATFTYTGTGSNGNWADPLQWAGFSAPPTSGVNTDVIIEGSDNSPDLQDVFNNDLDYDIDSLTLSASYVSSSGDIFLGGGDLTVDNEIVNNENSAELNFNSSTTVNLGDSFLGIRPNSSDIDFNGAVQYNFTGSTIAVTGGGSVFFDGGISGAGFVTDGRLTIDDGSFVRIGNTSSAVGEVVILDGTLQINSASNLGTNTNVNVLSTGVFDLNNFDENIDVLIGSGGVDLGTGTLTLGESAGVDASFTYSGVISGSGGITKNQSGETVFSGSHTYTGPTAITGGTLRLSGSGRLSNSTDVSVSSGAVFDLNGITDTVDSISGAGTIRLGGGNLSVDEATVSRTFSGNIVESGELTKNGSGTLILTGSNEFTVLDINSGRLQVASSVSLGSSGAAIQLSTATLATTTTFTNGRAISTASTAAEIDVLSSTTLTQSGVISGSGNIEKVGNGVLVYNASNTYTGDTEIQDGILRLGSNNRISNSSDVIVSTGATLDMSSRTDTVRSLTGSGSVSTGSTGSRLTVNAPSGTFTFDGVISGPGGYTKAGNHTQQFSAAQGYTGATQINDGILRFTGSGDISSSSDVSVAAGATWDLNGLSDLVDSISGAGNITLGGAQIAVDEGGSGTRTFSGVISETGSISKSGTHTLVLSGANTFSGTVSLSNGTLQVGSSSNLGAASNPMTLSGGTLRTTGSFTNPRAIAISGSSTATIEVNSGTTLAQTGNITAGSLATLNKTGNGALTLNNSSGNNFVGDIDISDGTLTFASGDIVGNATDVTVSSGATFVIAQTEGIDGLSGSGSVQIGSSQLLDVGLAGGSTTFSGVISGSGGRLTKSGAGTFTLAASNTYTGATTINGGILRLIGSGRLSNSTDVTVNAAGTLDLNGVSDTIDSLSGSGLVTLGFGTLTAGGNNGGATYSGDITESGSFAKIGSGTQTLSGTGSWNGGTSVTGGVLRVSNIATNLGTGNITLNGGTLEVTGGANINTENIVLGSGGGVLDINTGSSVTMTGAVISGSGSLTKADLGSLTVRGANTYTGDTIITGGTLNYSTFGASLSDLTDVVVGVGTALDLTNATNSDTVKSISGSGAIRLGGATLTVNQDGGTTTFSGVISEVGGITKEGTHTLRLTGSNTYTGLTTINEGTIEIDGESSLGAPTADVVFGGGTLYVQSETVTFGAGRSVVLNADGGTIFVEAGGELTIEGVVGGTGPLVIESDNEERVTLSGSNSFSGGVTVIDAELRVTDNDNLGANSSTVTLSSGTLAAAASFTNEHAIVIDGSGFISAVGSTLTHEAGISGVGNLRITGGGEVILTAPATHAGNTTITAGTVLSFGSGELPDAFDVTVEGLWDLNGVSDTIDGLFGSGTVQLGGGTLTVGAGDGDGDFAGSIQETGAFVKTGAGVQVLSGVNTHTQSTVVEGGVLEITSDGSLGALAATLTIDDATLRSTSTFTTGRTTILVGNAGIETTTGTTLTFDSPLTGATGDLAKLGDGVLDLTAANTYTGTTEVLEGTLRLSGGGLLADTSDVTVQAGATFDATDIVDTIGGLGGAGDVLLGLGTLTIGASDADTQFSGVVSGIGGALVKVGTGVQTLSGVNTYTGGTFINGGTVRISQSENLGALGTVLSFDGGTLNTTASFGMIRGTALEAGGGTINVDDATTLAAAGNITGPGSLTKTGDGTLILSGFSTYIGGTVVNSGAVEIGSVVNLGSTAGALTLDGGTLRTTNTISTSREAVLGPGGGTFDVVTGTTLTRNAAISGPGALIKAGDGVLTLTTANTYIGRTRINAGVLRVSASNQLGDPSNFIQINDGTLNATASFTNDRLILLSQDGGTIDVDTGSTLTQSQPIANTPGSLPATLTKIGGGQLNLTAANTYLGATNISGGTVQLAGGGQLPDVTDVTVSGGATLDVNGVNDTIDALSGSGDVLLGAGQLTIGGDDGGGTFSGVISGSGSLVKIGAGTQNLRTKSVGMDVFPNTFTGGVAINGGVLDVEGNETLGDPAGPLSFDGGALQVSGDAVLATTRATTLNAGGGTLSTVGEDASMTLGGVISGSGSLTKVGVGTATLTAANTYTGDTVIDGGLLEIQGAGRLPDTSTVSVNVSSTAMDTFGLRLNDIDDAINGLNGAGTIDLGSGTLTIGAADAGGAFSGVIEGSGGVAKAGTGTQTFSGANTYTGGAALNGGVLEVASDANLGDPTGDLSMNGGVLSTTTSFATARATSLGPNNGIGGFRVADATTLTHNGVISGPGGMNKSGDGTLVLTGANTYTGFTDIEAGVLQLGGSERLSDSTNVDVAAGAVFDLADNNESIGALTGAGDVTLGAAQLVIGLNNAPGVFTGVVSGTGDLLKEGLGIQTLTGANTYSGATFADRGELRLESSGSIDQATLIAGFNLGSDGVATIDGAGTTWDLSGNLIAGFDGAGQVNIDSGATITVEGDVSIGFNLGDGVIELDGGTLDNTLGTGITVTQGSLRGSGTVIGNVFNQDTVAPGLSAGILTLDGAYSQDVTGTLEIEIGGDDNSNPLEPDYDLFDITGTAGLAGDLVLSLIDGFEPMSGDSFTILDSGALAGEFANVADGQRLDITAGGTGSFLVNYTATSVVLSDFQGVGTAVTGDFDGDGKVDNSDLNLLLGNWGSPTVPPEWVNGFVSPVDNDELNALLGNWGFGVSVTVPEPTTSVLGLMASLMTLVVSRVRRC